MADGAGGLRQLLGGMRRGAVALTEPESLAPPIGGWNTRDAFAQMDPTDALVLTNFYPDFGGVNVRPGAVAWLNLKTHADVATLAVWHPPGGELQPRLLAASGGGWYDASAGGAIVPIAALASGFAADWWQSTNFNERLFLVNGRDAPQSYNGTVMAPAGFVAATDGPSLDVTRLEGVQTVHNRLYFWTGADCGFWYGDLLAITGDLHFFDFSMLVPDGGSVIAVENLTYDGGLGIASYVVFVLSSGAMLAYGGTDPSDPGNFQLEGIYNIAAPMGLRAIARYGGDVYLSTTSDHTKLSQLIAALRAGTMPPRSKVSGAQQDAAKAGRELLGWQAIYHPFSRRLIFNVPKPDGTFDQHVYTPQLDAWSLITGLGARCWVVWGDRLMYGGAGGQICEIGLPNIASPDTLFRDQPAWNSVHWNSVPWVTETVVPISALAQQAWNMFGSPLKKRLALVRPVVGSLEGVGYSFAVAFDYAAPVIRIPVTQGQATQSLWDTSPWDTTPWSSEAAIEAGWQVAGGDGSAISFSLSIQAKNHPLIWMRTDYRLERGVAL